MRLLQVKVNAYSTVVLVIFLPALIVAIVTALTVCKKKINAQNYDENRKENVDAGMKACFKAAPSCVGLSWPGPPPKMATFSKHNPS